MSNVSSFHIMLAIVGEILELEDFLACEKRDLVVGTGLYVRNSKSEAV